MFVCFIFWLNFLSLEFLKFNDFYIFCGSYKDFYFLNCFKVNFFDCDIYKMLW
uniref:ATPase subunit 8 n=1 Tax=Polyascus gregaria TaxID=238043 RepID=H8ZWM8_9CRUS|nr:ATPase subunit 8 [Polyascus gregaria]